VVVLVDKQLIFKFKHNSKGKKFDELSNDMERDKFMTAQEALDYGLIDEIFERRD
jgi:ATP-dependent Clp protease protease subunit